MSSDHERAYLPSLRKDATLLTLLEERIEQFASKVIFEALDQSELAQAREMTYVALGHKAKAIAATLQQKHVPGDRVLLIFKPGLDFIAAFWGCLYAGAIAVPAYPPRKNNHFQRLQKILNNADAHIILSTQQGMDNFRAQADQWPALAQGNWIATDSISPSLASQWRQPEINPQTLALLQYTSGSTGTPKGVMIQHRHLLQNFIAINHCFQETSQSSAVCWLPPYHDMGLIGGILQTVYVGGTTYLMEPVSFLQKPHRWLSTISEKQVTTAGGPNFAYDLCVNTFKAEQAQDLDLSHWNVAFTGAELIQATTLNRFAEIFAPYGFNPEAFLPCYGMAESTLLITGQRRTPTPKILPLDPAALRSHRVEVVNPTSRDAETVTEIVSCGAPPQDVKLVIVDPQTDCLCPSGTIGEVWVQSPSIAAGYWQRPELSQTTFEAILADNPEAGPFCARVT